MPTLNYLETALLFCFIVSILWGYFIVQYFNVWQEATVHVKFLRIEFIIQAFSGIMFPIYVIIKKKTIRDFMWDKIKEILS